MRNYTFIAHDWNGNRTVVTVQADSLQTAKDKAKIKAKERGLTLIEV